MMKTEKAIYGLAMPFDDAYFEYEQLTDRYTFDRTNKESVTLDSLVGVTLGHDYSKELGRTGSNLSIAIHDRGLFFKLIPESPIALSAYKKVKRGAIRHCSVSYLVKDRKRDIATEQRAKALARMINMTDNIVVKEYKKILVFEICIVNHPANKATFCTTDKNDPRLKGVEFDDVV